MNGFFVTLFKKKSHVGTASHSCVEFQFSPPPAAKNNYEYESLTGGNGTSNNQSKDKATKKRKCETDSRIHTSGGSCSNQMKDSSNSDNAAPGKKTKTNVRDGRMLTLWKPKKRR